MSESRAFRGVWIPAIIWLTRSLSIQEKVMLVEIESLSADPQRGCFKSNKAFAEFFGLSAGRVSQVIKSLEEKGFISIRYRKEGERIVERNIFTHPEIGLKGDESKEYRDNPSILGRTSLDPLEGIKNPKGGYLENADHPIKNPKGGYLENAEERDTSKSNTYRGLETLSESPRSRAPSKKMDFSSWPTEPSAEVLSDWKKIRKAPLTQTAVKQMAKELHAAAQHGYGVDHCLAVCCLRNWRGFKLEWLLKHENQQGQGKVAAASQSPSQRLTRNVSVMDQVNDTNW